MALWKDKLLDHIWEGDIDAFKVGLGLSLEVPSQPSDGIRMEEVSSFAVTTGILEKDSADKVNHKDILSKLMLGHSILYICCMKGHKEMVKILLDETHVDPNDGGILGGLPLYVAAAKGYEDICRLLIEKGASVDIEDEVIHCSPLHISAEKGYLPILKLLIENSAPISLRSSKGKMTALHHAVAMNQVDCIEYLLAAGSSVNALNAFGNASLMISIANGHEAAFSLLLHAGADVNLFNSQGYTPLHLACHANQVVLVTTLLQQAVDVNAQHPPLMNSALHVGAAQGNAIIVALLLESGANPNCRNRHSATPLKILCGHEINFPSASKFIEIAELLLYSNADICLPDADGNTPLHALCVYHGQDPSLHSGIVWLLHHGANPHTANKLGISSLDIVSETLRLEMLSHSKAPRVMPTRAIVPKPAAEWLDDRAVSKCQKCHANFSILLRRHHCRMCGGIFCRDCSSKRATIEAVHAKPVRVCDFCYDEILAVTRNPS